MPNPPPSLRLLWTRSPTARALVLAVLVLLLQIPVFLVSGIAREREARRNDVVHAIGEQWGHRQVVTGPWIELPYAVRVQRDEVSVLEWRTLRVLPKTLEAASRIESGVRTRGIFDVPVYAAKIELHGTFDVPELLEAAEVNQDAARLVVGVSDVSALRDAEPLRWNDRPIPFAPGRDAATIEAPVTLARAGTGLGFHVVLHLAGTHGLFVAPAGEESALTMMSEWPHPSFQGQWLPETRTVDVSGFTAEWRVSVLARGFPTAWHDDAAEMRARLEDAAVGVVLATPVDPYAMSGRSTRYAILFFAAVLGVLWVLEVRGRFYLHPLHYLLTSAALCTFHLLIVAFAEHVGFVVAYVLAAGMVTLLLVYYARAALGRAAGAAWVGATCLVIYAYLYVCLANEDHALLFGALGIFAGVAASMVLTRGMTAVQPVLDDDETSGRGPGQPTHDSLVPGVGGRRRGRDATVSGVERALERRTEDAAVEFEASADPRLVDAVDLEHSTGL